jgi:hypothetical protein
MNHQRRRLLVFAGVLAVVLGVQPVHSSPPAELVASMNCQTEPGSGRLICTVDIETPRGLRITWCDALVVAAPPAATPLRARVRGTNTPPRAVLGFVLGSGVGGRLEVLVRAVACPGDARSACVSLSKALGLDVPSR